MIRMTIQNNRKYLAEIWIENEKNEEFKKTFLESLIKQWMGHGRGFDADMVDGMHWEGEGGIEEFIIERTKDTLRTFAIGLTHFSSQRSQYYLGFEAIYLYNIEEDGTPEERKMLPWSSIYYDNSTPDQQIPDLYTVIEQLFNFTYLGGEDHSKTNKEIYKEFKDYVEEELKYVDEIHQFLDDRIINGQFNADTVNGFRFFVYTPEDYAELKTSANQYDPEYFEETYGITKPFELSKTTIEEIENEDDKEILKNYIKLNSIHNIFIIKTKEEIQKGGYEDGVYPYNPDTLIINKYYQFRVALATVDGVTQKYLQYKYQEETTWKNICPAADFIDEDKVKEYVINTITNSPSYILNTTSLSNSLKHITITDSNASDFPLINYLKKKFVGGAYYTDNSNVKNYLPLEQASSGTTFLNLNGLKTFLEGKITIVSNALDSYKTLANNRLASLEGRVTNFENRLNNFLGNTTKTFSDLDNEVSNLRIKFTNFSTLSKESWRQDTTYIGALRVPTSKLMTWDAYCTRIKQGKKIKGSAMKLETNWIVTQIVDFSPIPLAAFYFSFAHYHRAGTGNSGNTNKWVLPSYYSKDGNKTIYKAWGGQLREIMFEESNGMAYNLVATVPKKLEPYGAVTVPCSTRADTLVRIESDGTIQVNCLSMVDQEIHCFGQVIYQLKQPTKKL